MKKYISKKQRKSKKQKTKKQKSKKCEEFNNNPVVIIDYPKDIKAFYMRCGPKIGDSSTGRGKWATSR